VELVYNSYYIVHTVVFSSAYPNFEVFDYFWKSLVAISLFATSFAAGEKIKKELFVLHTTNAKTKK